MRQNVSKRYRSDGQMELAERATEGIVLLANLLTEIKYPISAGSGGGSRVRSRIEKINNSEVD